ncbi:Tn3 family transposase [Nocardiopsis sp. LOL_012]|uniref:Tn3 family transposase n=1 Tax=Nocardiopsis sp. LOL_012 TaxID=3345409 RepID=UPI003A8AED65
MPHEFLSDEQIARYTRFPDEVSVGDLEQFFRLDAKAHKAVATKRSPANKLGWALQWGTVRMLGVFLPDNPTGVPEGVVPFVADQLGVDPACVGEYRRREKAAYEHSWEIRDTFDYTDFSEGEEGLREYLAARVWATEEGPRTLFDRAIVHLVNKKVLLPEMTVLSRVVTSVRRSENARLHASLRQRTPDTVRSSMTGLLQVPDGARFSELKRLRTEPTRVSSQSMVEALDRTSEIGGLGDTRLWRTNTRASYGPLDSMSRHTIHLDKVRAHWEDMLRVAGSLTTGAVRAYDLVRMISRDGRPTGLGDAFAHYGRIFKTLRLLQFLHDESYRRMITAQLNISEGRHQLARKICFGNRGELKQRYREGLEDQLGALGLALNAIVWWNSLYIDAAVTQLRADGFPATEEMCARLSPLGFDHINFLGSYAFPQPDVDGGLRPLRAPDAAEE